MPSRRALPVLALLAAVLAPAACRPTPVARAEILWDRYGVPHVFADDVPGLAYGLGWAEMRNHADLILRLYGEARGRAAEYWGEDYLDGDEWVRLMGVPERAARWDSALEPRERALLDAFVAGVNDYAREHADALGDDLERVLPVVPSDVLAHVQRVIEFEFVTSRDAVDHAAEDWGLPGSNAWAIAPARTASGHAMLLANPHLPWSGFYRWFEAQLTGGGVNGYGATLVGMPLLAIGFNDAVGWTHTVNTLDGADLYELRLEGDGYRWEDGVRPFEIERQTLKVRTSPGATRDEPFVIRRSVQGPVVAERRGKALALRVVNLDESHLVGQYWDMIRAGNLQEFEAALGRLQMPFFTVMYADRDGHIMHLFGGRVPVRPAGDYDWSGVVPGAGPRTLWTATHPYADLPRVVDPPSGWLQNANDPPWTTTFPRAIDPDRYPKYMAPRFMSFRAQRSVRMLEAADHLTFDDLVTDKFSTRFELADRILDDLLAAAGTRTGLVRDAAAVLDRWDRSAEAESRGAVLFERFWREYVSYTERTGPFATRWDPERPLETPAGLANPAEAVRALQAAALQLGLARQPLDVAWGAIHRLRLDGVDLAANGGPGDLGIFRVIGYRNADDGREVATGGDSYVAAIEFANPVRALAVLAPGNATQHGSPHRTDQLGLVADKRLRPVWRTRAEIQANLELREQVGVKE
jgi:acyl-homoserine-lactone acylase